MLETAPLRLLRAGEPVAASAQTLRALELLVASAPETVTREQLRAALWPEGTHVDFDTALNTVMRRVRTALGDDGAEGAYVATIPGRGYRFVAPTETPATAPVTPPPPGSRRSLGWLVGALAILAAAVWVGSGFRAAPAPRLVTIHALTTGGGLDYWAEPASDGARTYFLRREGGHWNLMQTAGGGAEPQPVTPPLPNMRLLDVSRDGSQWLLGQISVRGLPLQLWRRAAAGGVPERLGDLQAQEAVWTPDGSGIIYSSGPALYRAASDGSGARKLASLPGAAEWLAWSPDRRVLTFSLPPSGSDEGIWQWRQGGVAKRMNLPAPACCGQWSADGRYFFFSHKDGKRWDLWAKGEGGHWPWRALRPVQLTFGPGSDYGAFTAGSSDQVTFYASQSRLTPEALDLRSGRERRLLAGRNANMLVYSPDGRGMAFRNADDGAIWMADAAPDASITHPHAAMPPGEDAAEETWSWDGRSIAFDAVKPGSPRRVYVMSVGAKADAAPRAAADASVMPGEEIAGPTWSPDNRALLVDLSGPETNGYELGVIEIARRTITLLPGSHDLAGAAWSPDGHWIAAMTGDQRGIEIMHVQDVTRPAGEWRTIATGHVLSQPLWSRDGRSIYFQDLLAEGEPLFRFDVVTRITRQVTDFRAQLASGAHRVGFMGMAPDGEMLLDVSRGFGNLQRASVRLP